MLPVEREESSSSAPLRIYEVSQWKQSPCLISLGETQWEQDCCFGFAVPVSFMAVQCPNIHSCVTIGVATG